MGTVAVPETCVFYQGLHGGSSTQVERLAAAVGRSALVNGILLYSFHCCHDGYTFHAPICQHRSQKAADINWPNHLDSLVVERLFHGGRSLAAINMHSDIFTLHVQNQVTIHVSLPLTLSCFTFSF